jgi:hypothetical protein
MFNDKFNKIWIMLISVLALFVIVYGLKRIGLYEGYTAGQAGVVGVSQKQIAVPCSCGT